MKKETTMSGVREMTGRPSEFNQETADKICELISQGQSVRQICKGSDMPAQSTVYKWLNDFESFSEQYARARESQAEMYAEEIIAIADSSTEEAGAVAKARLQVDARKWYASKVAPKKYGDRIQQDINANINVSLIDRVLEARKRARGEDGGGTS